MGVVRGKDKGKEGGKRGGRRHTGKIGLRTQPEGNTSKICHL